MVQPVVSKERVALLDWLDDQRQHVLGVLRGPTDDSLRRPVLPSGWTCLGLVRHLAVDIERFWVKGVITGQPIDVNDSTGWETSSGPAEAVFELYRQEVAAADAILATADLDAPPARWPEYFSNWRLNDAREVILHMITETAVHAGHLDAARELLDGRTWLGAAETNVPRD